MKPFAWLVLLFTAGLLGGLTAVGLMAMVHAVITNGDGAGMAAFTLIMGACGACIWAWEKIHQKP